MNKNVFLWGLYDFGNTFLLVAIEGLYLSQWVVLDNHVDDIWYGATFSLSTVFLLLTSPFWGSWSDRIGRRLPFIKYLTFGIIIFGLLLGVIAVSPLAKMQRVVLALILFLLLEYLFQLSLVFYDALLAKISTSKTIGRISGFGEALGQLGWIIGPLILLPFSTKQITLIGEPGRAQVILPAIILTAVFCLPMVFKFKEPKSEITKKSASFKEVVNKTISAFKFLIKNNRNVSIFLLAFMFISDALLTIFLYFGIYLNEVYKINDSQKVIYLALVEIAAILSGFIIGKISDTYGSKRMLIASCIIMIIAFSLININSSLNILYLLTAMVGFGLGGFFTTSRVLLIKISPVQNLGEYFGFYATFQKFASIIGPLTWGVIILFLRDSGFVKYQSAAWAMAIFMIIGTFLLTKVKEIKSNV